MVLVAECDAVPLELSLTVDVEFKEVLFGGWFVLNLLVFAHEEL